MKHSGLLKTDSRRPVPVPQRNRRAVKRQTVTPKQVLPVVIRCGQGSVCRGRIINVSAQGMLVEFSKDQVPPVSVDAQVSVKLHYLGDCIWLPGMVRHRMGRKMGFYFPALTHQPKCKLKHSLAVVLHSLSRAGLSQ